MRLSTRLDRYPGKMVSRLAKRLVDRYANGADGVLDPFCGSGAILVAAERAGLQACGVDLNPLAELFCRVKIEGFDPICARELGADWVAEARRRDRREAIDWNHKGYWFTPGTIRKFETLRGASDVLSRGDERERAAVLLSYALAVRLCSRADQRSPKPFISQRARRTRLGRHYDPTKIVMEVLADLSRLYGMRREARRGMSFVRADIRDGSGWRRGLRSYSHAITSPPYINAQDYFRNFKLELHFLEGMLPFRVDDLRERFVGTERGRLLEGVPRESMEINCSLVPALLELTTRDPRLSAVVHRYFHDMSSAFDVVSSLMRDEGCLVVVCGDNLVGGMRIRTWAVLDKLLQTKGFSLFDRFSDRIRDRLLAPTRLGHRGLIKEEVVSAYRLTGGPERADDAA